MSYGGTIDASDAVTLAFTGELDAAQTSAVRSAFQDVAPGVPVVVDLDAVSYIESTALGALIGGIRRVRDGGGVVVLHATDLTVRDQLHTNGIDRIAVMSGDDSGEAGLVAVIDLRDEPATTLQSVAG